MLVNLHPKNHRWLQNILSPFEENQCIDHIQVMPRGAQWKSPKHDVGSMGINISTASQIFIPGCRLGNASNI